MGGVFGEKRRISAPGPFTCTHGTFNDFQQSRIGFLKFFLSDSGFREIVIRKKKKNNKHYCKRYTMYPAKRVRGWTVSGRDGPTFEATLCETAVFEFCTALICFRFQHFHNAYETFRFVAEDFHVASLFDVKMRFHLLRTLFYEGKFEPAHLHCIVFCVKVFDIFFFQKITHFYLNTFTVDRIRRWVLANSGRVFSRVRANQVAGSVCTRILAAAG